MASAVSPRQEIIHAYRHLLRAGLHAVHFSSPSRHVIRDQLRAAFRDHKATYEANFDRDRIRRTVWFLNVAGREAGLESKILKSLVRVAWERTRGSMGFPGWKVQLALSNKQGRTKESKEDRIKGAEYEHYERTIMMLNETMGMCLPVR